ncbi:glucose 1-dehydrogenase [Kiritimatiellota bacterium B12222]|nr:glucose 1-dehydrogenase [Kiritimatiellota bacterium B12222]
MHPTGSNPFLFNGKVALVTGGTSGIGKSIVAALAKAGALVCYCGRRAELGEDQAKELRGEGFRVEYVKGDVTDEAAVQKLIRQTVERHGRIDFVINNAGLEADPHPIHSIELADYKQVMEVNLTGTFLMMKHAIPAMRAGGGGAIVNIASVLGEVAMPLISPYVAAKHAVIGLTKSVALEEAMHKIRVNAVAPGAVNTDMLWRTMHDSEEAFEQVKTMHPMGRVAEPDDIAEAVLWLCSEGSAFVTGQVINVDGGFTAQ